MYVVKVIVKLKNDKSAVKFSVFASSMDEAINKVLEAEKAPKSAIIYAKVAPFSIYDIKRWVEEKGSYYFTRKTLRFFKQNMSDFSVKRWGDDKFYICAPIGGHEGLKSEKIFNPFTNELEFMPKN